MKPTSLLLLSLSLYVAQLSALELFHRQDAGPAVVSLKVKRSRHAASPLQPRQGVTVGLDNELTSYSTNISIGTPAQDLSVRVDTGSSDLWVNTDDSQICSIAFDPCSDSGSYNANSSSSYKYISSDFNVSYADGSGASGDYASDKVKIGGVSLDAFQFGIGYQSDSTDGILGLGYTTNEAQVNSDDEKPYSNLPQALVDANLIKSNAFSLWLDDLQSSTGSILFGGVDADKYTGKLSTLPTEKIHGSYTQFALTISRMATSQSGKSNTLSSSLPVGVILDSGSTITYLPNDLVNDIYKTFNVRYSRSQGSGFCSCDLANQDSSIEFTFTSPTISVPIRELVIDPNDGSFQKRDGIFKRQGGAFGGFGGDSVCLFGISPSSGSISILGDTFLRSAYVVFDLANNQISMAQTNFNSTSSRVQEINSGSDGVPDATSVSNVVQASITAGGGARIGNPTATSTSGSDSVSAGRSDFAALPSVSTILMTILVDFALVYVAI